MKKRIFCGLSACTFLLVLSGCSTIVHGTKQKVEINTEPGAIVKVNGQQQKATPAVFNLRGESGYDVVVEKKGYQTAYSHMDSSFRVGTTILGNLLWLLPGLIVDFMTGSAYELPDHLTVPLEKK